MVLETKQILVTVKTYPNPSKKHVETVCIAGIDLKSNQWIRLYPIPFRDLEDEKKFKKYNIIELKAEKASSDKRPESYKVDSDSIRILDYYSTKKDKNWALRKKIILPTLSSSLCSILEENKINDKSLGMFKPQNIRFAYKKIKLVNCEEHDKYYAQLDFNKKPKKAIEKIPFDFRYSFSCEGHSDCKGHNLTIIDWEIFESFRKWRLKYKDENTLLEKISEKWLNKMCSGNNDTYFYVGNMHRFRDNFMVLGVFYPPKI
ncbi:MAG: hypothetical protein LLF28_01045 [Nitrospiraceae bacterium]|nr:hypothetical protein [Nitrospiraceae bacterium]